MIVTWPLSTAYPPPFFRTQRNVSNIVVFFNTPIVLNSRFDPTKRNATEQDLDYDLSALFGVYLVKPSAEREFYIYNNQVSSVPTAGAGTAAEGAAVFLTSPFVGAPL